jgi:chemotaxis protein methyltransferase CheR
MSHALSTQDLELFQRAIEQRLGLRFDDNRLTQLAEVLERRVQARRLSAGAYLAALETELEASNELSALARELTVGETYFFRHTDQFTALREIALPERRSARAASRQLRLLSAGCASGEEAFSLAIVLRELDAGPGFETFVHGIDLNPEALAKAERGLYGAWSLRETPDAARERWFVSEGRDFRLKAELRHAVRFAQHNLTLDAPDLLAPATYDVIFCRNVLMYFSPVQAAAVVQRLSRALVAGGFLFLGHAETLRGLSHDFQLKHTHNTFYYQRRGAPVRRSSPPPGPVATATAADVSVGTASEGALSGASGGWVKPWLEGVERSSERIAELSRRAERSDHANTSGAAPAERLQEPLELLQSERFGEALALLQRLSPTERTDPAALLLRAALLTHQGDLAEAEKVCHELLRIDDLNAGAHYLLALCCERRGSPQVAVEHDRTAVYLDGAFAMPHLHLGLMARRRREPELARQELTTALALLEGEDASRLLLFGGGFSRGALLTLCRSELANLKGAP